MGVVESLWLSYEAEVLPASAGPVQRLECRRAFFSGCAGLFGKMTNLPGHDPEPTPSDLKLMDDIDDELRAFGESGGRT